MSVDGLKKCNLIVMFTLQLFISISVYIIRIFILGPFYSLERRKDENYMCYLYYNINSSMSVYDYCYRGF